MLVLLEGTQAVDIAEGFEQISGFPQLVGAIDGCHIAVRTPPMYPLSYLNHLKSHSIILQVLTDSLNSLEKGLVLPMTPIGSQAPL